MTDDIRPSYDGASLAVLRRHNRVRVVTTVLMAVVLYWAAACIAAVTVGLVLALRVFFEGGDIPSDGDDARTLGIALLAVIVISAVVGSVLAAVRLPTQRRRLERRVLAETGARVVTGDTEQRRVRNLLDGLAIAAALPPPRFAVVDDPAPNSFAVGTKPKHAVVAVTRGAIDSLARDELEAVLAYEVSRVGSWDVALSSWTVALTGAAIATLDEDGAPLVSWGPARASAWLRSWALRDSALDRDRAAVRFTRNPAALLRALETLRDDPAEIQTVSKATAPLWFEVPAAFDASGPTLDERIAALRHLVGVGPDAPAVGEDPTTR